MVKRLVAFFILGLLLWPYDPALGAEPTSLTFGLISVQTREGVESMWAPILDALGKQLGIPVTPRFAKDYAGIIWAMRAGEVQIAWMGNEAAIPAVDNAGAEVFCQTLFSSGSAGYRSYLIARKDGPIGDVPTMLAKAGEITFAAGDPNSTSGYLVPAFYLFGPNHSPAPDFKRVIHGNHEANFMAVADGRADLATVSSTVWERMIELHPIEGSHLRILWESPLIPPNPLLWRKNLDADTKQRIRNFFLAYGVATDGKPAAVVAAERAVLARFGVGSFAASDNRQLLPIRRIELFDKRLRTERDSSLSADEKASRLTAIDAKLQSLEDTDSRPAPVARP